jgi:uncharacterized protein YajQ (UPF0234 family)
MPTFDVVSEVDLHEVANAVDQSNRELRTRFDFKGTDTKVEQHETVLALRSESEFQLKQVLDILQTKLAKRGVDIGFLEIGPVSVSGKAARQTITIRQGVDADLARQIVKRIKASKVKVQTSIQGEKVRVAGKKRDDLQQVIGILKDASYAQPLQYVNFRD